MGLLGMSLSVAGRFRDGDTRGGWLLVVGMVSFVVVVVCNAVLLRRDR